MSPALCREIKLSRSEQTLGMVMLFVQHTCRTGIDVREEEGGAV